jgi:hypothetical protein
MATWQRTPWSHDAIMAALTPVDQRFRDVELYWGVGRLERLVGAATLQSYKRGWEQWRAAIESGDTYAVQSLGPKMIHALDFMDREAKAAGHKPLCADTWETMLPDGRVLCIVRTNAEAHRLARADKLGEDGTLPPDIASAIHHQRQGRELVIWTIGELARVLPTLDVVNEIKRTWPGAVITSGPHTGESDANDWATGDPLRAALEINPDPPSTRQPKKEPAA